MRDNSNLGNCITMIIDKFHGPNDITCMFPVLSKNDAMYHFTSRWILFNNVKTSHYFWVKKWVRLPWMPLAHKFNVNLGRPCLVNFHTERLLGVIILTLRYLDYFFFQIFNLYAWFHCGHLSIRLSIRLSICPTCHICSVTGTVLNWFFSY